MDSSAQLSPNQLSRFLDICLEYYRDGIYSSEYIESGECSTVKRKSMKHDFKEFYVGTKAKPKRLNDKLLCSIQALLDSDTTKVIEARRKIRSLNNKIKELEDGKEASIQYEINQRTRVLEQSITEKINSENTDKSMRETNRILRYKELLEKNDKIIQDMRDNTVSREIHDKTIEDYLELKETHKTTMDKYNKSEDTLKKEIEKCEEKNKKKIEKIEDTLKKEVEKCEEKNKNKIEKIEDNNKKNIEKIQEKHNKEIMKLYEKLSKYSKNDEKNKKLEKAKQLENQMKQLLAECDISDDDDLSP